MAHKRPQWVESRHCALPSRGYPADVETLRSASVGLGGDGDEVAAIRELERTFGVQLDTSEASRWVTAGDVFSSLARALPPQEAAKPETWKRFAEAITSETGVDPSSIKPGSPLLTTTRVPYWVIAMALSVIFAIATFRGR